MTDVTNTNERGHVPAPRSEVHSSSSNDGNAHVSHKASPCTPVHAYNEAHSDVTAGASPNPQEAKMEADETPAYGVMDWLKEVITPPEIWTGGNRPLKDEWDYAKNGGWTTDVGVIRFFGQLYSVLVVFPTYGIAEVVKWSVKRPTRLVAIVVLFTLLAQLPPLKWMF
jgi:hypothetical protein